MNPDGTSSDHSLYLITQRFTHHAGPSGYDRLADLLPGQVVAAQRAHGYPRRALARVLHPVAQRSGSAWYHRESALAELHAAALWLGGTRRLFHVLYGENQYRYLAAVRRLGSRRNRLVCTYHTPAWRFREVVRDLQPIRCLDSVIVVSRSQLPWFSELLSRDRVHFVPHGVDTEFFAPRPTARPRDVFRVLTVGHHLRDFAALDAVSGSLEHSHPHVRFDVVARADALAPLRGRSNVSCHSGVTDAELRGLYQQAHVLFLPLQDATANNSLLEGLACGLPVVSTELQGVHDYVRSDCCTLAPRGDVDALRHALLALHDDPCRVVRMGVASRAAAEAVAWPVVAGLIERLHKQIMA